MTVQEVAKKVIKVTNMTQQKIAEKAGLSGQGTVGMYLNSKSMRVDSLLTILNCCGYELVARSADGKLPEFVIGEKLSDGYRADCEEDKMKEMIRALVAEELAKGTTGKE